MRFFELAATLSLLACGGPDVQGPGVTAGATPSPAGSPGAPPAAPAGASPGAGCPAEVTIRVSDATGGAVPGVEVRGLAMSCVGETSSTVCSASPPPGTYDVVIGAPGYDEARVSMTVAGANAGMGGACSQSIELGVTLQRIAM